MATELEKYEISDDETVEYKVILIGDTSVGKTCLFKKLTSGIFLGKNISTVGIDRKTLSFVYEFEENGKKVPKNVVITITDTAGQERYKSIIKAYYRGSNGIILLYDITDKKSFEHIPEWISNIKETLQEDEKYVLFLLGTKEDLVQENRKQREVTIEEAKKKCEELEIEWGGECSSKEYSEDKYKDMFKNFVRIIYEKIGYPQSRDTITNIDKSKEKRKANCACNIV